MLGIMDALVELLDGPRARGAFLLRSILSPPWSLRIEDEAPLTVVTVVEGDAWIVPESDEPRRVRAGDVAVLRGPDHYVAADAPDTPPQVIIHPGQRCTTVDGDDVYQDMALGVRTWGNDPEGSTILLTGTYAMDGEVSRRLLEALPGVAVVEREALERKLIDLLSEEVTSEEPGQKAILDRLLDLLVVVVLRAWFARPDAEAPDWYLARSHPVAGPALRMMHNHPAHPWTVEELAKAVGVSRAAFARKFSAAVGQPPMTYLTSWRMAMAADLLLQSETTIGAVARQVGYGSPYALSTAFKRLYGVSPQQYRKSRQSRGQP